MPLDQSSQTTHPPPWQVRWKRPRLDSVTLGFNDEDGEPCEYEDIEEAIQEDWVPISCASIVLTRDEAMKAILELHKRDRLLRKKRVRSRLLLVQMISCKSCTALYAQCLISAERTAVCWR